MKITDTKALQIIKRCGSSILEEFIDEYPDNERDGRTDLDFIADEISYHVSCYNEDGHTWKDDLDECRELLRETNNGKTIPIDPVTFKPRRGYWPSDIEIAKNTVAEYKRLVRQLKNLQKLGYYGRWYIV